MSFGMNELGTLLHVTLTNPRRGLRAILALNPPMAVRLMGLALMAVGSALVLQLGLMLTPPLEGDPLIITTLKEAPVGAAIVQGAVLLVTAGLVYFLGRAAGGTGNAADALLAIVWMQAVFLAVQLVQTLLLVALPPLAVLLGLAAIGLFFWILTLFVAELHGFVSTGKVFFAILAAIIALSFTMALLLGSVIGAEALGHV